MSPSFAELEKELGYWKDAGVLPRFWWRDDDAHAATPALTRAVNWSNLNSVSGLISAIPARVDDSLADVLQEAPLLWVAQHGWSHTNHVAPPGDPSELGNDRPLQEVIAELSIGHQILSKGFKERYLPVVVPPWNRLSAQLAARLPSFGYIGLSSHCGLHRNDSPTELRYFDTHVDASEKTNGHWTGASEALTLSNLVRVLHSMRTSRREEPIGILTHHLFMNDNRTWDVLARIVETTRANGGMWLGPPNLFLMAGGSSQSSEGLALEQRPQSVLLDHIGEDVRVLSQETCKATFNAGGRGTFSGGTIFLHPAGIGEATSSVRIEFTLVYHDIIHIRFGIEGAGSEAVEFDLTISQESEINSQQLIAYCESGSQVVVRVIQPLNGNCNLTLKTKMSEKANSNNYAWAFISDIKFARTIKTQVL